MTQLTTNLALKKTGALILVAAALLISTERSFAAGRACRSIFTTAELAMIPYRETTTHPSQSNSLSETSQVRESTIYSVAADMKSAVLNGATPIMDFYPAANSNVRITHQTAGYESGELNRYKASNIGKEGVVRGTLILPVSGHAGVDEAKIWAKSDTYSIYMTVEGSYERTYLIKDAKSLDIVTYQEIEIPMVKGKVVKIYYHRSGSAGPNGFPEGRIFEFEWNGK